MDKRRIKSVGNILQKALSAVGVFLLAGNFYEMSYTQKRFSPPPNCNEVMKQPERKKDDNLTGATLHKLWTSEGKKDENLTGAILHKVWTQVTFSFDFEKMLIPHKMRYLQEIGLDMAYALIIIHQQNTTSELQDTVSAVVNFGVPQSQIFTWGGIYSNPIKMRHRQVQRKKAGVADCDWIINLDGDEFPRAPTNDMISFLESVGNLGFEALHAVWLDRFGPGGSLPNISDAPELSQQFPVACDGFSQGVARAYNGKHFAFRGHIKEKGGGSHLLNNGARICRYPFDILMDHYKWNWAVLDKLKRRVKERKKLKVLDGQESISFLTHFRNNDGNAGINDPKNKNKFKCKTLQNKMVSPATRSSFKEQSCGIPLKTCSGKLQRLQLPK